MRIPFGEWLPDQPALGNPGATVAKNVIPLANGYIPLRGLSSVSSALSGSCRGYFSSFNGSFGFSVAGTSSTLELLNNVTDAWDDVSKSGGYSAGYWDFALFNDQVIAVSSSNSNPVQEYTFGSSSLFADLGGSPPTARLVANIRDFVVLGHVGGEPNKIHWSGYNNSASWTPSRASQGDTRFLSAEGGPIQRIVPGQIGVIFQKNAIWLMEYVGPPTIFNLRNVSRNHGAVSKYGVCWHGDRVFYLSYDGFYQYQIGGGITPIGSEKVNRWFQDNAFLDNPDDPSLIRCAVDPLNNLVFWAFAADNPQSAHDTLLIYNWVTGMWSYAESDTRWCGTGFLAQSSNKWGRVVAFDTSNQLCVFGGAHLDAVLETTEVGMDRRSSVNVRALVEDTGGSTAITIAQAGRNYDNETATFGTAASRNARGVVNFRTPYRYHRFRVNVDGQFTSATGVELEPIPGGLR